MSNASKIRPRLAEPNLDHEDLAPFVSLDTTLEVMEKP